MSINNIIFNNKTYSVEDSSLSAVKDVLRNHFSTVMNGSGAVINFGETSYNIDSTKLSSARNNLISHLGTVAGNGYNVTVNGVRYGIDSLKMANAVSEIEAVLGGSQNDDIIVATFADNSWSNIIKACKNNEVPETWSVGDTKSMTINDQEYNIQIIGKNHDIYADGSGKAPLTLQIVECYDTCMMNPYTYNKDGWTGCVMRTEHLPSIMEKMPVDVQEGIKEVKKFTVRGDNENKPAGTLSSLTTVYDKLFLLSATEVLNNATYSNYEPEGTQYEFYANGGSGVKKLLDGTETPWWFRGGRYGNTGNFTYYKSGNVGSASSSTNYGVSFGFCF